MRFGVYLLVVVLLLGSSSADEKQCGKDVGDKLCPNNFCCSREGFCGLTIDYCGDGCQSQCHNLPSLIPESTYNSLFPRQNSEECTSKGFYTYPAFLKAALSFPRFALVGDDQTRRREIAAFLAHTSHETAGNHSVNDPVWGFCHLQEINPPSNYCNPNFDCPKEYYGRGPFQLRWNDKYIECGEAINEDLLNNPDLLVTDPVISFKSAFWYWMTWKPETNIPTCHQVITGEWHPTPDEEKEGWCPGFGLTINIVNGLNECGVPGNANATDRIAYYNKYTGDLSTTTGDHTDCEHQVPIGSPSLLLAISK